MGPVGLEPTTYGLKVRSSAIELEALRRCYAGARNRIEDRFART
ncbi:hypothetical protein BN13_60006 [Nostocoides jenkinsii Ben 74]|uniref:Uncharacterized protein n=1 Tax=Nostocoides jenkinsii Ben 74 TaxID=1193518 RepID=A0A077MDV7_9MICO|nr:hypothetical protein BN13_60006 [Tetrasphaera jenkinsii Ben 74]